MKYSQLKDKKRAAGRSNPAKRGTDKRTPGDKPDRAAARPVDLHQAKCTTCNQTCMLPFRPNTDKPVYCSDCFTKKNSGQLDTKTIKLGRGNTVDKSTLELAAVKRQLKTIEDRLNRILDIISPPQPQTKKSN